GRAVFDAARAALGRELPLIAEDLGVITPAVDRLREALELPGMVVLQFGFDPDDPRSPHHPDRHVADRVAYTCTHDHDTVRGWHESIPDATRARVDEAIARYGVADREPHWALIRLALASPARVAMVQAQDVLGLGAEARMNRPGRASGAWRWRLAALPGRDVARRLRAATEEA